MTDQDPPLTEEQAVAQESLDAAFDTVDAAIEKAKELGLAGCKCNGESVEIGEYRCRKVDGGTDYKCHRCQGNDRWKPTARSCGPDQECERC